jgi:hypothetical protein
LQATAACSAPDSSTLTFDQTGVGKAVVDLLWEKLQGYVNSLINRVTIVAGQATTVGEDGVWLLPRKELVGTLQVLLQTRRLLIPRELPHTDLLLKELQNFKAKVTLA